MKVLFVTLSALEVNTSVTISNIGLLKGLEQLNAEVTIVMPEISNKLHYYDARCDLSRFKVLRIHDSVSDYIGAAKNSAIKSKIKSVGANVYNKFKIYDRGTFMLNKAASLDVYGEQYDLVISTSDPKSSHLFVREMIKNGLRYGKWIQHWGDPMYGDISRKSLCPKSVLKRAERKLLHAADRVIYVSPFTKEQQATVYAEESAKMRFVPLPCDEAYAQDATRKGSGILTLSYLGDYSSHIRNIMPLYNACKKKSNVRLIVAGNTDLNLESCDNVVVYPRVGHDKVKEIESESDVYVCVNNLHGTQIPGKIYYAAASSKPILILMEQDRYSDMRAYLEAFDRFVLCRNEEEEIEASLQKLMESKADEYTCPEPFSPKGVITAMLAGDNDD
ncbi:MAG: hypothetical protein IJW51_00505 [Clostridia bacterium]|nr:hypothetical protein [Clostridia bacterium]